MDDIGDLWFTDSHEWVRRENDEIVVGISDYLQEDLSDISSVELPEPDDHHHYEVGEEISAIESLKTSRDLHAPVAGFIIEVNIQLLSNPELLNSDPYDKGWMIRMKPDNIHDVAAELMTADEYEAWLPDELQEI